MIAGIKKILPFLDDYIPDDLALKGISKVSPKIGSFLKRGLTKGLPLAGGLQFLRSQFSGSSDQKIDPTLTHSEKASLKQRGQYKDTENMVKGAASLAGGLAGGGALGAIGSMGIDSLMGDSGEDQETQQQQPQRDPNAIDQVLADIHDSSMGQYIRKSVQSGSDPMEIISTIMRKTPDRVNDIEKKTGDRFENVIDAYIKKIMGGSKVQRPEAAPQQQQQGGGMEQLMAVLQQVRDARQRRAGQ